MESYRHGVAVLLAHLRLPRIRVQGLARSLSDGSAEPMPPTRNPHRADDPEGNELEPMSLGNMRQRGVGSVDAECQACGLEASAKG